MRRAGLVILAVGGLLALALALRLLATKAGFDLPLDGFEWRLRGIRAGAGVVVGAALAASGVMLQSLMRNPLASPSLLGLTAGAGLGVMVAIYVNYARTGAIVLYSPPYLAALAGAMGVLLLVYTLAQRQGLIEPVTIILVGVVVSLICGAAAMFLQHLLPDRGVALGARWFLGSLSDETTWGQLTGVGALTLVGIGYGAWAGPAMDAAALDDREAASVGVPLHRLRLGLFVAAGALTAGTVVLAGPIGFVGLVCPHAIRLLGVSTHRALVVGAALAGACVVVLGDTAVRVVDLASGRMPLGVLTVLLGGPVFILMLRAEMRR